MSSLLVKFQRLVASRQEHEIGPIRKADFASPSPKPCEISEKGEVGRLGGRIETAADLLARREREKALGRLSHGGARIEREASIAGVYPDSRRVGDDDNGFVHIEHRFALDARRGQGTEIQSRQIQNWGLHGDDLQNESPNSSSGLIGKPLTALRPNFDRIPKSPGDVPYSTIDLVNRKDAEVDLKVMAELFAEELPDDFGIEEVLFLDTETTGLAGGAGTYVFLVGVAYFRLPTSEVDPVGVGEFVVEQFMMEDYCDEPAMLEALDALMSGFRALATFNGKSFDAPMLRGRFLLNGMRPELLNAPHFDLLPICQRFWRETAGGGSLGVIERAILDVRRDEDIPSHLIPQVFFDYARGVRRGLMASVLRHNFQDVYSMGALLARLVSLYANPDTEKGQANAGILIGVGRLSVTRGRRKKARDVFEKALALADNSLDEERAARLLAIEYRHERRWDEAAELWKTLHVSKSPRRVQYVIEYAKHLEHRLHDLSLAEDLVRRAIDDIAAEIAAEEPEWREPHPLDESLGDALPPTAGLPKVTSAWRRRRREDLERRHARLIAKLKRSNG